MMGPNVLWLAEWASQAVSLRAGMRILDLGCGMAASSIFLAREFDVNVAAVDLWIKPTENWKRIEAAAKKFDVELDESSRKDLKPSKAKKSA